MDYVLVHRKSTSEHKKILVEKQRIQQHRLIVCTIIIHVTQVSTFLDVDRS